jgi:hypothetical protein
MKTIDLELAKELQQICKEKGITMRESFHAWRMNSNVYMSGKREYFLYQNFAYQHPELTPPEPEKVDGIKIIRAYTLDELLEWLPRVIQKNGNFYEQTLQFSRTLNTYRANYDCEYDDVVLLLTDSCWHPNPTNACAKLLIYLIKEGLI